jgi:hypothetical protein
MIEAGSRSSFVNPAPSSEVVDLEKAQLMAEYEQLLAERDRLRSELETYQLGWPPGHFYSPIPSLEEIRQREAQIFGPPPDQIPGIDLNLPGQIHLLRHLQKYYPEQPFTIEKEAPRRYFFANPNFSYGESIVLYCLIRYLQPRRIVEIGSGYSSCALLDTNELFCGNGITSTFIDPYPELLLSLVTEADRQRLEILPELVQNIPIDYFAALKANDILFIDSSHVSKVGSDLNHVVFNILPQLKSGVWIHFHDIAYPFEYPKTWIYQGRAWNEAYLLRAFLQYNNTFQIRFFNSYLHYSSPGLLASAMPLIMNNPGTSIWLRKV